MSIENFLILEEKRDYKCYDILREELKNEDFYKLIKEGIDSNSIRGFDEDLWKKINSQNIRGISNFDDVFRDGANRGYCTVASKQLSYSLDDCFICGGTLHWLINTVNCSDGSHTWILHNDEVIDTSLMIIIKEKYAKEKMGYLEENRYNPNLDPIYSAAKEFACDPNLRKGL